MSIETVRARCIANDPHSEITSKLDDDINKVANRFIRIVKTSFHESLECSIIKAHLENPTTKKNELFERHKLEYIHNHLTMLIDLFDYKPKGGGDDSN